MADLIIDGDTVSSASGKTRDILNPATGQVYATVSEGGVEDVDRAVAAAGRAYESWRWVSPRDRAALLNRFADVVAENVSELAAMETRNVGKPLGDARAEVAGVAEVLRYYAGAIDKFFGTTVPVNAEGIALTVHDSLGVAAMITPWNFPLAIANNKVAAALAAGNTCVLKPAETTPLTSLRYAELALEAGLPDGVLNVVTGPGESVGNALVCHPEVAKVSFTGSTRVGAKVASVASTGFKRLTLELGGKSACIVFDDADLEKVGREAWRGALANAGQDCCARSRVLVHESAAEELVERYGAALRGVVVGDPEHDDTDMGPLVSAEHRERVDGHVEAALDAGARVVAEGCLPDEERLSGGYFFAPMLLGDVAWDSPVAKTEIFGPIVSVTTFHDEDEAIRIANSTPYGLSGSIWTRDGAKALRVARAVRSGMLSINSDSSVYTQLPFGGQKHSGVGRELGMEALAHNTEVKSIFIDVTP